MAPWVRCVKPKKRKPHVLLDILARFFPPILDGSGVSCGTAYAPDHPRWRPLHDAALPCYLYDHSELRRKDFAEVVRPSASTRLGPLPGPGIGSSEGFDYHSSASVQSISLRKYLSLLLLEFSPLWRQSLL